MPTAPCLHIVDGETEGTKIDLDHFPFSVVAPVNVIL